MCSIFSLRRTLYFEREVLEMRKILLDFPWSGWQTIVVIFDVRKNLPWYVKVYHVQKELNLSILGPCLANTNLLLIPNGVIIHY